MSGVVGDMLQGIIQSIPSRKQRVIHKNFRMLRKEIWFEEIEQKYGKLMVFNPVIREFVSKENLETILKNVEESRKFRDELEMLLKQENI
ncbi:hypothetical protein AAHB47_28205 [Bacillus wiedmannii]